MTMANSNKMSYKDALIRVKANAFSSNNNVVRPVAPSTVNFPNSHFPSLPVPSSSLKFPKTLPKSARNCFNTNSRHAQNILLQKLPMLISEIITSVSQCIQNNDMSSLSHSIQKVCNNLMTTTPTKQSSTVSKSASTALPSCSVPDQDRFDFASQSSPDFTVDDMEVYTTSPHAHEPIHENYFDNQHTINNENG